MRRAAQMLVRLTLAFLVFSIPDRAPAQYAVRTNFRAIPGHLAGGEYDATGTDPDPGRFPELPAYDNYQWMCTDSVGVTADEKAAQEEWWTVNWPWGSGPPPEGAVLVRDSLDLVTEGSASLQVVLNHVEPAGVGLPGASFAVIFPPQFEIDENRRYPMIIKGLGFGATSLNDLFFATGDEYIEERFGWAEGLITCIKAYLLDTTNHRGAVFIYFNCGGYGNMSASGKARESVDDLIQHLHLEYGCDKNRIIAEGGSRGAFSALTLAENRVHDTYDYTVIGIFIKGGLPLSLGSQAQNPLATTPSYADMWNTYFGDNGYLYDGGADPCRNPYLLWAAFGPDQPGGSEITFEGADEKCPDHPDNLERLWKDESGSSIPPSDRPYLCLGMTTHEAFFPAQYFLDMEHRLDENGFNHTTLITLQAGHGPSPSNEQFEILRSFVGELFNNPDFKPGLFVPDPAKYKHGIGDAARNYFLDRDLLEHETRFSYPAAYLGENPGVQNVVPVQNPPDPPDGLPFSVTIPFRLGCKVFPTGRPRVADEPGIVYITGRAGTQYYIRVDNPASGDFKQWGNKFQPLVLGDGSEPNPEENEHHVIKWWPSHGDPPAGFEDEFPVQATAGDILEWTVMVRTAAGFVDYSEYTNYGTVQTVLLPDTIVHVDPLPLATEITASQPAIGEYFVTGDPENPDSYLGVAFGVDAVPPEPWVTLSCSHSEITPPGEITLAVQASSFARTFRDIPDDHRCLTFHIDLTTESGTVIEDWVVDHGERIFDTLRAGDQIRYLEIEKSVPDDPVLYGTNEIRVIVEDITPAPYNQPPHAASGLTATATCQLRVDAPAR